MDIGVISHSSREEKLCKPQRIDIISNLPDHFLNHIISFLPTIDAIRSSVLSRRWQYLWTSIPNIDLEYKANPRREFKICSRHAVIAGKTNPKFEDSCRQTELDTKFLEFVNRVPTRHDASDIKRLKLQLYMPYSFFDLNLWLEVAINHNFEEINLELRCRGPTALPFSLFTCHSLVILKISARLIFNPPPFTSFLNLKKLSFIGGNVTISISMLKSLTIKLLLGRMITISSINLTCLNFSTYKLVNICIGELPYLDSAYVSIPYPRVPTDGFAYDAGKLFLGIYNVKDTRITNGLLLAIIYVSKMSEHIPTFYNLIHLKVSRITSPWFNEWMKFLVKTPNLEHLDLLQVHEQRWNY